MEARIIGVLVLMLLGACLRRLSRDREVDGKAGYVDMMMMMIYPVCVYMDVMLG